MSKINKRRRKARGISKWWLVGGVTVSVILFLVAFVVSQEGTETVSPAPRSTSVDSSAIEQELMAVIEQNYAHPIPAVGTMMRELHSALNGQIMVWPFCQDIDVYVTLQVIPDLGDSILHIPRPDLVQFGNRTKLSMEFQVSQLHWDKWQDSRPSKLWHEGYHLLQLCGMAQATLNQSSTPTELHDNFLDKWNQFTFENEAWVIGVEIYWYQRANYLDTVFESQVIPGWKVKDVWRYLFITEEERLWPPSVDEVPPIGLVVLPETEGVPSFLNHPNFPEWKLFVAQWYSGHN